MADFVGQRFGEYQLGALLGRGNFGDVYLGEHIHEHTSAAIKVLQTRLSDQDLKGFIQEASTIFRLKHPHIVQLRDFGIGKDDTPYLAMHYAPHGTLRNRHPKGTCLPPALIASYVTPIASALQYAHDRGIIHRDIKPENILLGPQDEIWLSDFGIAVVAQSTRTGDTPAIGGTVSYMAPEQLQGKPQFASDQYALGIMVYEWLCGEHPFKGNYIEIAMQHIQAAPPSLREKIPSLSADIEQVVMIALAKDPNQRFATVQAFAKALEQASQKESDAVLPNQESSLSNTTTSTFLRTNDTSTFIKLSPDEASTGAKRQVMFSDEKSIEVSLPSGIQHGTSLRINDPENNQISKIVTILIEPKLPSSVAITPSLPQPQLIPPVRNKQFSPPTRKTVSGKGIVIACAVLLCIIVGVIFLPQLLRSGKNSSLPGPSGHNTPSITTTPTTTLTPVLPGTVLYQADWLKGDDGWGVGGPWRTSNGMLTDDGSNNSSNSIILTPPYQPQSSNYAVDASIQFNQSTDIACGCLYIFGVVIGSDGGSNGYACQIDVVYNSALDAPATAAIVPVSDTSGGQDSTYTPIAPIKSYRYNADQTKLQTFHIEVRGSQITFSIDNVKLLQIPDNSVHASDIHISGESVGLIDLSAEISVSSFKVTAL